MIQDVLDTFAEDSASESIDLADLELECAVSLEAAYNDFILEECQFKYQSLVEGTSVINEGFIDSIKKFFKKLFNIIKKFLGFGGGGDRKEIRTEIITNDENDNRIHISRISNPKAMSSKCRERLRKLMSLPESEIRQRLQSWKKIKIYQAAFLAVRLWTTNRSVINCFLQKK